MEKGVRSFGPCPPGKMRKEGIRDQGIGPGCGIQSVEMDVDVAYPKE